ncbi:hypothetical protein [Pseudomonas putida]
MPAILLEYKTIYSNARFEGILSPEGAEGYKLSGTLTGDCCLYRPGPDFVNTVRFGYGGTSQPWIYVEKSINDENTFSLEGSGSRQTDETVDFCLAINEGISGQFTNEVKIRVSVGGPPQNVTALYETKDFDGEVLYAVYFYGTARADGPNDFVIEGDLMFNAPESTTAEYVTIGYKALGGKWNYKSYSTTLSEVKIYLTGSRASNENIQVIVGATNGFANTWTYGDPIDLELPELFNWTE